MSEKLLKTSGHAVFALQKHIVFVTKYRHGCLTAAMMASMREQIVRICKEWRCDLMEFNGETDHVHLLVSNHPTVAISALVSSLKTVTARKMRSEFAQHLRPYYGKPVFWSASYAAFSVGAADLARVIRYIQHQESPSILIGEPR